MGFREALVEEMEREKQQVSGKTFVRLCRHRYRVRVNKHRCP